MATKITEEELIVNNMGLVKKIAKMFRPPNRTEYEEYIQVGRIGLMKAIRKHIPEKGALSTIAWNHIKWEIIRYIKKHTNIGEQLPSNIVQEPLTHFSRILPDNLSETEISILNLKLDGYKSTEIAKIMGMDRYHLIKQYKVLLQKIRVANEKSSIL